MRVVLEVLSKHYVWVIIFCLVFILWQTINIWSKQYLCMGLWLWVQQNIRKLNELILVTKVARTPRLQTSQFKNVSFEFRFKFWAYQQFPNTMRLLSV